MHLLNRHCLLSIAPLNSRLWSYRVMWLSRRSMGSLYVPSRLEQPPVTFHRPVGIVQLTSLLVSRLDSHLRRE